MADHSPDSPGDGREPLEAELEALTPAPLSVGVAERIGRRLRDEPGHAHRLGPSHRLLLVGLAAAACAVAFVRLWGDRDGPAAAPGGIATTQQLAPVVIAAAAPLPPPSLGAYRRALADSPDALDSLLGAHAPRLLRPAVGGPKAADSFQSARTRLSTSNGETL